MKSNARILCFLVAITLFLPRTNAANITNNQSGFRLTIELQDGSKIIGKSGDETFLFSSDTLGEMKLPLEKIRTIECQAKTNAVILTTATGDSLTALFITKEIKIETAFGNFKLPSNLLKRVQISAIGKGRKYRPGLLALWSGEGNVRDSVGTHNGTLQGGAGFTSGQVGQAFSFHNSGSYARVPESPAWDFGTKEFTIELWVRFNSLMSQNTLVASDEGGGFVNKWIFWQRQGFLEFFTYNNGGSTVGAVGNYPFTPTLNQFYHLAVTRSGSIYTFYINGVEVQKATDSRTIPVVNAPLTIGFSEDLFADGDFDEVSIYDRALSADEIKEICVEDNNGEPLPAPQQASPRIQPFRSRPSVVY